MTHEEAGEKLEAWCRRQRIAADFELRKVARPFAGNDPRYCFFGAGHSARSSVALASRRFTN